MLDAARRLGGSAFGWGLKRNVEELTSYLSTTVGAEDRIYLFGFSRGAFTARVVAGLINRLGLLRPGHLGQFDRAFDELYRPHFESLRDAPAVRRKLRTDIATFRSEHCRPETFRISFLGVWDTVKSYGYALPKSLPHTRHNPIVDTVRHALSIDEDRSFFSVTTWGGRDLDLQQGCMPDEQPPLSGNVKEVWFAGDHCDVGGGHEHRIGLALTSLRWMVHEAARHHLRVDDAAYRRLFIDPPHEECRRHREGQKLGWRCSNHLPRRDLRNCPMPPTLHWTTKPSLPRAIVDAKRGGTVLIHASAKDWYAEVEQQRLWGGLDVRFLETPHDLPRGERDQNGD